MFRWYRDVGPAERRTFWACLGGWSLDALDVQMFSLAIPALVASFGLSRSEAGLIGAVTLVAAALGGWLGGLAADRIGRVRALQITVLWFAVATFLAAFAQSFAQLLTLKALQGIGFGAEWAAGAALMAEAIGPEHRGRALGAVQGGWALGWGAAVLLATAAFSVLDQETAWRALFACGLAPALLLIYLRRSVPEPARPVGRPARPPAGSLAIFAPGLRRVTVLATLLGLGAHGGFHALFTWLPTYLSVERGASVLGTGLYLAIIIAAFGLGCLVAGGLVDRLGRRRTVALYAAGCMALVVVYLLLPVGGTGLLLLGAPLGFCTAGIPASLAALFSELFPDGLRGTGMGFCYNAGRLASGLLPLGVGLLSEILGLGPAIGLSALGAYGLVLLAVALLPDRQSGGALIPQTVR
ncbi:MFS family permease [Methylobacterium sp. PvP062]|uniref:MFS family permease n=1 Tax=Methylobacterium radiotolerans TaxID=31998 RepID=A0ABV2NFY6_9HYPH|nr:MULTISPECIES: MFS transporter [unclassified Methylobacterium]MBP2497859.1 MFS family permease [Methylobacterium sp. PvP105]MBP2502270.1 MFS family permease [Methylobacterium sp. PvP109]MCX7334874.1 MFS transporter [Hyphomicrobiales bacterium]